MKFKNVEEFNNFMKELDKIQIENFFMDFEEFRMDYHAANKMLRQGGFALDMIPESMFESYKVIFELKDVPQKIHDVVKNKGKDE